MADRSDAALRIIVEHQGWAFAAAAVPVPILDSLAVTGANLRMLHCLSELFDVPFAEEKAKKIVSSLFAGAASGRLARRAAASRALKMIPGLGSVVGILAQPALAAAATYAVGHLFLQHFEGGGSVADFDPEAQRQAFHKQLESADEKPGSKSDGTPKAKPANAEAPKAKPAKARASKAPARAPKPDDLRKIEGIGPKIASLLAEAGITTWTALATSSPAELRQALDRAGPRYRMHDPATWPQQAALAARGAWDDLDELQQNLRGGRVAS